MVVEVARCSNWRCGWGGDATWCDGGKGFRYMSLFTKVYRKIGCGSRFIGDSTPEIVMLVVIARGWGVIMVQAKVAIVAGVAIDKYTSSRHSVAQYSPQHNKILLVSLL